MPEPICKIIRGNKNGFSNILIGIIRFFMEITEFYKDYMREKYLKKHFTVVY